MDQAQWDGLFTALPLPQQAPGYSVLVECGDETLYERQFGYSSLEYGLPITRRTVFHVASVSKQFTALCVSLLEETGRIDLSASIRRYFPELPACMEPVSVRHLLHHTGGMREQWDLFTFSGSSMEDLATPTQTLRALARQTRLNFTPGERYQYCNSGFVLLAQLVQRVTGRSLRQFAHERVFRPLQMESTYFRDNHSEICYDRAESYEWLSGRYEHRTLTFDVAGNTSLNATPRDLCLWLRELNDPKILPPTVIARMKEPFRLTSGVLSDYCRGIRRSYYRGQELLYHTGANAGFRSAAMLVPQLDLRIIVLSNYGASLPMQKALQLLTLAAPDALEPEKPNPFFREEPGRAPDGILLSGMSRAHVARASDRLYFDDGAEWDYIHTRGNEYRCAGSGGRLYALPDGTLGKLNADGSSEIFQPVQFTAIPQSERALAGYYLSSELLTFQQLLFDGETLILRHFKRGDLPFRRMADGRYLSMEDEEIFLTLCGGERPCFTLDKERSQGILFERTDAVR